MCLLFFQFLSPFLSLFLTLARAYRCSKFSVAYGNIENEHFYHIHLATWIYSLLLCTQYILYILGILYNLYACIQKYTLTNETFRYICVFVCVQYIQTERMYHYSTLGSMNTCLMLTIKLSSCMLAVIVERSTAHSTQLDKIVVGGGGK